MESTLGLFAAAAAAGSNSGSSTNEPTASIMEIADQHYAAESELELGLGLTIGGGGKINGGGTWGERGRILTAQDFPAVVVHGGSSSCSSRFQGREAVSGTKRAAESVPQEGGSPTALNQVVGWPPIRTYRMNSLVNQAKTARAEEEDVGEDKNQSKDILNKKICDVNMSNASGEGKGLIGFVKVNVDGVVIGRKVDLKAHFCYETLALMLEDMFFRSAATTPISNGQSGEKEQARKLSKLLDGSSEFVLTYEDREGDWMLVGDVPWGMFVSSVRRLRIMRTSEANGLAPICQDKKVRQRSKPI